MRREYAVASAADTTAIAQGGYTSPGDALRFAAEAGPGFVAVEIRSETYVVEPYRGEPREGTEVGRDVFLGERCAFEGTDGRVVDSRVEDGVRFVLVEAAALGGERAWEREDDVVPFEDG
jgi:hypothetical protein